MKGMMRALPLLGGLALVGTAAGVSLGHSAVSEINPLYFAEAPARFHSALVPNQPDWSAPAAPLTVASTSGEGLGAGCFGCASGRAEVYAAPAVVTYTDSWTVDARAAAAPMEAAPVEPAAPDPERERVVRYATYPVYAEQPQAQAQAQAPETELAEPEVYAAAEFVSE